MFCHKLACVSACWIFMVRWCKGWLVKTACEWSSAETLLSLIYDMPQLATVLFHVSCNPIERKAVIKLIEIMQNLDALRSH